MALADGQPRQPLRVERAGAHRAARLVLERRLGVEDVTRHLQVLEEAGLVRIIKSFEQKRPHTSAVITPEGRKRYLDYLAVLEQVLRDAVAEGDRAARSTPALSTPALKPV